MSTNRSKIVNDMALETGKEGQGLYFSERVTYITPVLERHQTLMNIFNRINVERWYQKCGLRISIIIFFKISFILKYHY